MITTFIICSIGTITIGGIIAPAFIVGIVVFIATSAIVKNHRAACTIQTVGLIDAIFWILFEAVFFAQIAFNVTLRNNRRFSTQGPEVRFDYIRFPHARVSIAAVAPVGGIIIVATTAGGIAGFIIHSTSSGVLIGLSHVAPQTIIKGRRGIMALCRFSSNSSLL